MQVAHDILIRSHHECTDVVGLSFFKWVKCQSATDIFEVDKVIHLTIGIAGDINQRRLNGRTLIQTVNRCDREKLIESPVVEQRLEYGEITDVLLGQHGIELGEFIRNVSGAGEALTDLSAYVPEKSVSHRTVL